LADDEIEGEIIVYQPKPLSAVTEYRLANINLTPMEEPDNGTRTSGIAAEYACTWASAVAPLTKHRPSCLPCSYLCGLLWCLRMYMAGECPDYDYCYPHRGAPSPAQIIEVAGKHIGSRPPCVIVSLCPRDTFVIGLGVPHVCDWLWPALALCLAPCMNRLATCAHAGPWIPQVSGCLGRRTCPRRSHARQ
jgi:hypothetical protein